jgi:hypothetical protein
MIAVMRGKVRYLQSVEYAILQYFGCGKGAKRKEKEVGRQSRKNQDAIRMLHKKCYDNLHILLKMLLSKVSSTRFFFCACSLLASLCYVAK